MFNTLIIAFALAVAAGLAFSKRLRRSSTWRATVTPLASMLGSGFLVSAPLLAGAVGTLALVVMGALLLLAFGLGGAIRFNIRHFEPIEQGDGLVQRIAFLSRAVLTAAYFISVTFYLQILAAFLLDTFGVDSPVAERAITTVLLVLIAGVGMWRGLGELESVERYTISLTLGMIGGLLLALALHNLHLLAEGEWKLPSVPRDLDLHDLRVLLGFLIIVQGFETSRYLGDVHPAPLRIRTMRNAQLVAAAFYIVFFALVTVLFHDGIPTEVTALIQMTAPLAVMPLLVITALGSQFSAAVADTSAAGGLVEDLTQHKLTVRHGYLGILLFTVALTWLTNVDDIIAYASRAFALYYMLQCIVALIVARRTPDLPFRGPRLALFALLGGVCLLVFIFGLPAKA